MKKLRPRQSAPVSATALHCSTIEVIEARIAPAAVFTLTDVDGDRVTIATSKGTNADWRRRASSPPARPRGR